MRARTGVTVRAVLARGLGLLAAVCACAQPSPPPGGPQDTEAPYLLSTRPEQRAIVPDLQGAVVFTFDETLSEQGVRDAVVVSPETGRATLERDGSELKVRIEGGWKPNTVYRVMIMPGIRDRFQNGLRVPTELVFSTGPQLLPTAIAGLVTDRLTGKPLSEARVVAISESDSFPHIAITDTAGFFGLRYLPVGRYLVRAYEDQNRNRQLEYREKQFEQPVVLTSPQDTQVVQLVLLARDSTAARLLRAEAVDSTEVRLTFDDYIDPATPLPDARVALFLLPDSTTDIGGLTLMNVYDFEAQRRGQTPADSGRAAPRLPPVVPPAMRPGAPGAPGGAMPGDTTRYPRQEMVLKTQAPLQPSARYLVRVSGITNVNGIANGGGSVAFVTRARTPPRDTAQVRRDTMDIGPRW